MMTGNPADRLDVINSIHGNSVRYPGGAFVLFVCARMISQTREFLISAIFFSSVLPLHPELVPR